jgi:hypothetical protein
VATCCNARAALGSLYRLSSMLRAPSLQGIASRRYAGTTFSTPRDDAPGLSLADLRVASNRHAMARDDDDFRLRPGKIRDRGSPRIGGRRVGGVRARPTSFAGQIQQAMRRAGGNPSRLNGTGKGSSRFNARGRGAAAPGDGSSSAPRRSTPTCAISNATASRRTGRGAKSIRPAGMSRTVVRSSNAAVRTVTSFASLRRPRMGSSFRIPAPPPVI